MPRVTGSSLIEQLTADAAQDGIEQLVVRAVIMRDQTVLLLRRTADDYLGGNWELPGGKDDPGETLDEALVREAREETGLDVTAVTGYLGSLDYISRSGGRIRQFNFTVDVTGYEPVVLTEHDRYQWSPITGEPPEPGTNGTSSTSGTNGTKVTNGNANGSNGNGVAVDGTIGNVLAHSRVTIIRPT